MQGYATRRDVPEVDTVCVEVPAVLAGAVEVLDVVVSFVDNIVIRDLWGDEAEYRMISTMGSTHHHSGDRAQEYRVRREVRCKAIAALEQVPRQHAETDDGSDVSSAANVLQSKMS